MIRLIFFIAAVYLCYQYFLGEGAGCKKYASKYSCSYVEEKASYDVYYWRNVSRGNSADDRYIGSSIGLAECESLAINHARSIGENWNARSYICMLVKDGQNMEKHRL